MNDKTLLIPDRQSFECLHYQVQWSRERLQELLMQG